MSARTDISGVPLSEGAVAQLVIDPGVGTYRDRAVGVVAHLDEESAEHVWFSSVCWWDIHGQVDWVHHREPVRTHTSLLFQIAEAGTDVDEVVAGTVADCPPADRMEELRGFDSVAAKMWEDRRD